MFEQELQRKFEDFREIGLPRYIRREGRVHLVENTVSTVIGARRAGKSYRVLQAADELINKGFIKSFEQVCLVDFDNPVLSGMAASYLKVIQQTFLKINPEFTLKTPLVFILDEVHRVKGWEEYVIDLSRNPYWKVLVTGSSSKLLRDDISTALRGKSVSSVVYPLSFSEFLKFKELKSNPVSTKGRAEIQGLFDEYLKWGGYPAVSGTEEFTREVLLREYFDTMILKDIIQRFNAGKPRQCIQLYNYLLANIGKPYTLMSAYDFLKQGGNATSRDAVRDYIAWAEDSWLLFSVPVFTDSQKEQERNYRKVYCIDWALAIRNSMVWDGSYSRALENMVFLQLMRKYPRVRYYLTRRKRQEVDFLAADEHGKPAVAVQVCWDMSLPDTQRRELEPLVATAKYFRTSENLVITLGQEKQFNEGGITVNAIPARQWLLNEV
jgi:predicted AAA+ superfamily ATPase